MPRHLLLNHPKWRHFGPLNGRDNKKTLSLEISIHLSVGMKFPVEASYGHWALLLSIAGSLGGHVCSSF